jgi:hypothetical protein
MYPPNDPRQPSQPNMPPVPPYQYPGKPPYPYTPPQTPPSQQKPHKPRRWPWIVALILVAFVFYGLGRSSVTSPTSDATTTTTAANTSTQSSVAPPTAVPTQAQPTKAPAVQKWTTVQTFSGNGAKKTNSFTVPADWRIVWSCTPSSFLGNSYNVIISVNNASDGSPVDYGAVNTICKAGNTGDTTEERTSGSVFLDVNSEGAWSVQVQELR